MSDNATDDDDVAADAEDPNSEPNAWESKEALDPNHSLDGEMSSSRRSKRGRRSKSQVYMKQIAELQARLKQAQTELIQERNMNELYCQVRKVNSAIQRLRYARVPAAHRLMSLFDSQYCTCILLLCLLPSRLSPLKDSILKS